MKKIVVVVAALLVMPACDWNWFKSLGKRGDNKEKKENHRKMNEKPRGGAEDDRGRNARK